MRSGYTRAVRFWRDSDRTVRIRWYRVAPSTPFLPYETIFSSYIWDNPNDPRSPVLCGTPLQGEDVSDEPRWSNGRPPVFYDQLNKVPCGGQDKWDGDLLASRDLPLAINILGAPKCCMGPVPPETGTGGQLQGGRAEQRFIPRYDAAGGQLQGGIADQSGTFTGEGGQEQGGEAAQGSPSLQNGSGGQEQGGEAAQGLAEQQNGSGGQAQGGSAHQGDLPYIDRIVTDAEQANGGEYTVVYPTPLWILAAAEQDQSGDPGE